MSTEGLHLPNDVERLKAMIAAQLAALAQRDAVIEAQHNVIEKQLQKLAAQEQELIRLLRQKYGPQKERIDPDQLTLFSMEELVDLANQLEQGVVDSVSPEGVSTVDSPSQQAKPKGHGRRRIPDHLPRETIMHELEGAERLCTCCGRLRMEIGREVSEQLEFIPAQLKVLQHERVRYACLACEEHVATAPKPQQPIDKGLTGLMAYLALSKYGDYLPLYRLEDMLSRSGILLRRSALCGWIAATADLLKPLYERMCQRVRLSHMIHTDDTSIKLLAEGQCQSCKFWTYVGDEANPYVVYEFSLTREGQHPSRFLEDFSGYLQADAFNGYNQVYSRG